MNPRQNDARASARISILQRFRSLEEKPSLNYSASAMLGPVRALSLGVLAVVLSIGSASRAHIDLLSPPPRTGGRGNAYLDSAPCGQRDPGRSSDRVSVFRPGETISVSWDAYVQHPSYFRLSFDVDGDDSFSDRASTPADPARDDPSRLPQAEGELILDYVRDPGGELSHVERSIRLPSEPCAECTLQLLQFIYDLPLDEATYYQCVDLVLEGEPIPPAPAEPADVPAASTEQGCALRVRSRPGSASFPLALIAGLSYLRRCRSGRSAPSQRGTR